jgi:hypothetical protein
MARTARKPRQKPKRTPSLAQRRADPGLRSRLPMSQLTPAQQASRRRNQQVAADNKNPLYDPTTQLAGHSLVAAAAQLADEQIKPKVDAYNRQITSATTQGTALASRAGDYYKQLAQQAMGTVASQKALSDMLNAQTAQVGQQSQAAFAGMGQAEQQRQAQDTALRGTGLGGDSGARVATELANQQGTAATLQQGSANQAAQTGSSWASLANAMSQAGQLRGGEVQGQLLNRLATQQGRQQIADVEATRGDLTTDQLTKLRQQAYENLVTNQGLNIKQQDLQNQLLNIKTDAQTATANRRAANTRAQNSINAQASRANQSTATTRRGQDLSASNAAAGRAVTRRGQDIASADRAAARKSKGAAAEPADVRKTRQAVNSISTEVKALRQGRSRTQVADVMRRRAARAGQRLPEDLLSAALDLGYDGHISPRNVQMLQGIYGVAVPAAWKRRPRTTLRGTVQTAAQQAARQPLGALPHTPLP